MCLDRLTFRRPRLRKIGYKVFRRCAFDCNVVYGDMFCYHYEIGKWHKASNIIIKTGYINSFNRFQRYKSGFHIFLKEEDAIKWANGAGNSIIKKVLYKDVVAEGIQEGMRVVVAKRMMIL